MSSIHSGLKILHRKEGVITEAECKLIGSARYYHRSRCKVVAQRILAKSISESLKICEICKQYQLLLNYEMKKIEGVSVCDLCIIYLRFPRINSYYLYLHYMITFYCFNFENA